MNFPEDLKYTKDHEWVRFNGDLAFVGITDYAQNELGEIVYVDVTSVGETVAKEEVFGSIEAVKTVSDLFLPLTGEIVEFNDLLNDTPELVNQDPYGNGWIVKIKLSDPSEAESLLNTAEYRTIIGK